MRQNVPSKSVFDFETVVLGYMYLGGMSKMLIHGRSAPRAKICAPHKELILPHTYIFLHVVNEIRRRDSGAVFFCDLLVRCAIHHDIHIYLLLNRVGVTVVYKFISYCHLKLSIKSPERKAIK